LVFVATNLQPNSIVKTLRFFAYQIFALSARNNFTQSPQRRTSKNAKNYSFNFSTIRTTIFIVLSHPPSVGI